jgi:hypothetical protein
VVRTFEEAGWDDTKTWWDHTLPIGARSFLQVGVTVLPEHRRPLPPAE